MFYGISENVIWTPGVEEVRLYDSESGEFRTLNSTAAEIWTLVSEGRDLEAVIATMADRHTDGKPEHAELVGADIRGFLVELVAKGLLVEQAPSRP